jgi:DNA-binding MarR family transcriptional regulator
VPNVTQGDGEPALGEVLDFMRLIWALDHGLQSLSKRMQATLGLTGPQRVALRVLGRAPGMSAGALAEILRLHPSTLTGILQRLEGRGLVRRAVDPRDRRRSRLELTARGRRLDVPTPNTVEAVAGRVLARYSKTRIRSAAEILEAVAEGLLDSTVRPGKADPGRRDSLPGGINPGTRPI